MRVRYEHVHWELARVLGAHGFAPARAELCAQLFADASRDGVASHGVNRFEQFIGAVRDGTVDPAAEPALITASGAFEQWDGRKGPGVLNAHHSMARAITLSRAHGWGVVGLRNTTHWMRGGNYGWQAADAGVIGVCWTNTRAGMPPWGSTTLRIGNNPLVIAVPRASGAVVLDMALTQFSYGAVNEHRRRGEPLPVDGGYDTNGELTRDPAAIAASKRMLPIGAWKGAGLGLVLDMLATLVTGGFATHELAPNGADGFGYSQVFIAIDPAALPAHPAGVSNIVDAIVDDFHRAEKIDGRRVFYPGERALQARVENMAHGIDVDPEVWRRVQAL